MKNGIQGEKKQANKTKQTNKQETNPNQPKPNQKKIAPRMLSLEKKNSLSYCIKKWTGRPDK